MSSVAIGRDPKGVLTLTLSRPAVMNAFDEGMIAELSEAFSEASKDPSVRVAVLRAEGKLFCSGADVGWMQRQAKQARDANVADARVFAEMLRLIHECPKPTVAVVQGHAFGGGVGLMSAVDIVIASKEARFAISEARFGILPSVIGPYITRALGQRQARRLAMTTEQIDAQEALQIGLVHKVVASDELGPATEAVIANLLKSGPQALREIKGLFSQLNGQSIDAGTRELTAQTIARVRSTEEAQEGFQAFFDKRPAKWIHQ